MALTMIVGACVPVRPTWLICSSTVVAAAAADGANHRCTPVARVVGVVTSVPSSCRYCNPIRSPTDIVQRTHHCRHHRVSCSWCSWYAYSWFYLYTGVNSGEMEARVPCEHYPGKSPTFNV